MKNILQSSFSILFTLIILFGPGIFINSSITFHWQLWVVIMATVIMFAFQPKLSKSDFINPDDKFSMLGISIMAILVTNMSVIEWALSSKSSSILSVIDGASLFMIWGGLAFRIYAIKTLKEYFSNAAEIQSEHKLFDKGIYAVIRHPSYTGAILTIIGTIIWLDAWKTFPFSLILIGLAYSYRIIQEEKMLAKHFGEKYRIYLQKTGALLPKFIFFKNKFFKSFI